MCVEREAVMAQYLAVSIGIWTLGILVHLVVPVFLAVDTSTGPSLWLHNGCKHFGETERV